MPGFSHHLFVCLNEREKSASRGSCGQEHAQKLRSALKDAVKDAGLKGTVRVNEQDASTSASTRPSLWSTRKRSGTVSSTHATPKRSFRST